MFKIVQFYCYSFCTVKWSHSLATVKVMTKTKVAPFYLGHGVFPNNKKLKVKNKRDYSKRQLKAFWAVIGNYSCRAW